MDSEKESRIGVVESDSLLVTVTGRETLAERACVGVSGDKRITGRQVESTFTLTDLQTHWHLSLEPRSALTDSVLGGKQSATILHVPHGDSVAHGTATAVPFE